MNIDQQLDAKQARRMALENRQLARLDRLERIADQMIGELSTGRLYVWPVGSKYREGTRADLIGYLIRNKHVI